jgi:hypothetical protein
MKLDPFDRQAAMTGTHDFTVISASRDLENIGKTGFVENQ